MRKRPVPYAGGVGGQAVVEFALMLPLVLLLLFAVIELGRAWVFTGALTDGARAGARRATIISNNTSFSAKVAGAARRGFSASMKEDVAGINILVNISAFDKASGASKPTASVAVGDSVMVIVRTDDTIWKGVKLPFFSEPAYFVKKATMRYEGAR